MLKSLFIIVFVRVWAAPQSFSQSTPSQLTAVEFAVKKCEYSDQSNWGGIFSLVLCETRNNAEVITAVSTLLLAIATLFLALSTHNSARAAKAAADHIPRVERGYVVGGGPSDIGNGVARIDIVNYGKTAAILTKVEWGFCDEKDFPTDAPVSELLKDGRLKIDHYRIMEDVLPPNRPPVYLQNTNFPISKAVGKIFYGKFTIFDPF